MVHQLAKLCDQKLTTSAIAGLAANLFGEVAGTYLASKLVSWIPFLGNAINASVTFGITQVIGWAAFSMFNEGLSKEEAIAFGKKQKISEQEMETIVSKMPEAERNRYDFLIKKLKSLKSSNEERESIAAEISDLIDNYC